MSTFARMYAEMERRDNDDSPDDAWGSNDDEIAYLRTMIGLAADELGLPKRDLAIILTNDRPVDDLG